MTQHYALTLRVAPGRDGVRSLRALLKIAGRLGLRAIDVRESCFDKHQTRRRRSVRLVPKHKRRRKGEVMDMRAFKKPRFLKLEDVRQPHQRRIARVVVGQFQKPDVVFEDGDKLGLSVTNNETLAVAYGWESDNWIGHVVELGVGKGRFEGEDVDMIVVKPISQPEGGETTAEPVRKKPAAKSKSSGNEMDDEVTF